MHYAGDVTYNVRGFLEKNNDLLFRDLREIMSHTTNSITKVRVQFTRENFIKIIFLDFPIRLFISALSTHVQSFVCVGCI